MEEPEDEPAPRQNRRTARSERTNVEFPVWRKKVDNTIFRDGGTAIPIWACKMWDFQKLYPTMLGKGAPEAQVIVTYGGKKSEGFITSVHPKNRAQRLFKLWFSENLLAELKDIFLMSYMRDLESRLSDATTNIEQDIPFWEFLDLEFDSSCRTFHLHAHYTQQPTFPELFKRLVYSPIVSRIEDELASKGTFRIHKQDWRPREEYETELGATNVLYTLIDTENRLLYIGEAENLIRRFNQGHKPIPHWSYYRYDALPPMIKSTRVALERMMIRSFASALPNKRGIASMDLSDYQLANERIDK